MPDITRINAEYLRPWKLTTLSVGVVLLILGSIYTPAPDWDVPISLIMAFFAYLTAPWSLRVIVEWKWRFFPAMVVATWFSIDGCYALYWSLVDPNALTLMRDVNFPASLSLYGLCGVVWLYRGTFRELLSETRSVLSGARKYGSGTKA